MAKQHNTGHSAPSDSLVPEVQVSLTVGPDTLYNLRLAINHLMALHLLFVCDTNPGTAINDGMVHLADLQQQLLRQQG